MNLSLGKRVAPPRFLAFIAIFVIGGVVFAPMMGLGRATMAAFDTAAIVFLVAVATLLGRRPEQMRAIAERNDANRVLLLGITALISLVVLVAVHGEVKGKNDTLVLAWLFSNVVYALHYAHMFYSRDPEDSGDTGGICFPQTKEPDYWDFVYFSFTLGMTFQTSDVEIASRRVRRVVIGQCMAAFAFNLGVLAFTINVLGGGGGS